MALFEFLATPARAWLVPACFGERLFQTGFFLSLVDNHNFSRCSILTKEVTHDLHRAIDMVEEGFVTGTEVVQTWLTIWSFDKPILRTTTMTGKSDVAIETVLRECLEFVFPELSLLI